MARRRTDMDADARWHLDKRVPIAMIVAIMVQTGGGIWWAATVNARVNAIETSIQSTAPQADRLTRVEVQIEVVKDGVNEIKRLIQQRPPAR